MDLNYFLKLGCVLLSVMVETQEYTAHIFTNKVFLGYITRKSKITYFMFHLCKYKLQLVVAVRIAQMNIKNKFF